MPRTLPKPLESTPFYAVAGAGDLAVEKLRALSKRAEDKLSTLDIDPGKLQEQVENRWDVVYSDVRELPARAQQALDVVAADVRQIPDRAQSAFGVVWSHAEGTYGELVGRGRKVVERITDEAGTQLKAVSTVEDSTTSSTTSAGKSASTSAKPTARKTTAKKATPKKTAKRTDA